MRGSPTVVGRFAAGLLLDQDENVQGARDLLNVRVEDSSAVGTVLRHRGGQTIYHGTAGVASADLGSLILTGGAKVIGREGTALKSYTTIADTGTSRKTGISAGWNWAQAAASGGQGPLWGMNATDTPQQWDGSAASMSNWTASAGAVPNGKYIVWWQNRIWVAGVPGNPSRLYYSEIGDPRNWPAANATDLDPNDGDAITGFGIIGPYLVVFKTRKVVVVYDSSTSANRVIAQGVGSNSPRSIATTPAGLIFLTPNDGVYLTDGQTVRRISDAVQSLVSGPTSLGLTVDRSSAAAAYFDGHYLLSVPFPSGAVRTLDYDLRHGSWWLHSELYSTSYLVWPPGFTITSGSSQPFLLAATDTSGGIYNGGIRRLFTPTDAPSDSYFWDSPFHDFGMPALRKRVREIEVTGRGSVDVGLGIDLDSPTTLKTVALMGLNSNEVGTLKIGAAGRVGRRFSLRLSNFSEIHSYTLAFQTRRS